jgi:hypothetical protein
VWRSRWLVALGVFQGDCREVVLLGASKEDSQAVTQSEQSPSITQSVHDESLCRFTSEHSTNSRKPAGLSKSRYKVGHKPTERFSFHSNFVCNKF